MTRGITPDKFEPHRTVTQRLRIVSKLTDRVGHGAYLQAAGIAPSEGRCLAAVGGSAPRS